MPHYFTPQPAGPFEPTMVTLDLAGRRVEVATAPGVFSQGRLDLGTRVLLRDRAGHEPSSGRALDLGCGWGPIALHLALASPALTVFGIDVNERAIALLAANATRLGLANVRALPPQELDPSLRFDAIWSNPPIRIGKAALHELLATYLPRLTPDGEAHLVVSKNLGADSLRTWITEELGLPTTKVSSAKGFRVLRTVHPSS